MIKKLKGIAQTDLIKTSFFTSIHTAIRMVCGFVINKVMAIYLGPSGVALVGQFNNFYSLIGTFANGGISTGIVKYTAEFRSDEIDRKKLISTAFYINVFTSVIAMLVILIFPAQFSWWIMKTKAYTNIFFWVGATVVLLTVNSFILSVLNGLGKILLYTGINISSTLAGFAVSFLLIKNFQLYGAFLAVALSQSVTFFIAVFFVARNKNFSREALLQGVDKAIAGKLFRFSLMTIVAMVLGPVSQMILRKYIGSHLSWTTAGYWQGVSTISDAYLTFITSVIAVYYLPALSAIREKKELKKEVLKAYQIVMPVCILMAGTIFFLREFIINLMFTADFMPMKELFIFQLMGDVVKIFSWLMAYLMVAKAKNEVFCFFGSNIYYNVCNAFNYLY